jgi:ribosomal-protein-alanine N-acetyltransferase
MTYLRKPDDVDFEPICRLLTDSSVRAYLGGPLTINEAEHRAKSYIQSQSEKLFVIEHKQQFCGLITLGQHAEIPGTELSYQLLPEYHGKGIAYDALLQIMKDLSGNLVAETQEANKPSRRLLQKLGFTETSKLVRFGEPQVIAIKLV